MSLRQHLPSWHFPQQLYPCRLLLYGELLTAQISGIKNFIRDFSNLSEAEKEQLILWDDFLIYAVVLEENERIIEDIFSMRNLRYGDYTHFKNWEEHRNG